MSDQPAKNKYKIGIFGSAGGDYQTHMKLAVRLGEALGDHADSVIVATGASTGLPYAVAKAASDKGCEVWGYAPTFDLEELKALNPDDDADIYDKLIYLPADFPFAGSERIRMSYRSIPLTANCSAGLLVSGLWGTLNEFTNMIDTGKLVGVLAGTGGIADELPGLTGRIHKKGQGRVIFDSDPKALVDKLLEELANTGS